MAKETKASEEGLREQADRRMAATLEETGMPDPRDRYREWLRELRGRDEGAFRKALEYYEQEIVPRVSSPDSDPLAEWTEYGMRLAQRLRPGATVRIDGSGRSRPCDSPVPYEDLVLQLPTAARDQALAIRLPPRPTPAQDAAFELLVRHSLG